MSLIETSLRQNLRKRLEIINETIGQKQSNPNQTTTENLLAHEDEEELTTDDNETIQISRQI